MYSEGKYAEMCIRDRPYRVPGYPWTPAIFVLATAALVVNAIFSGPAGAIEGLGVVLLSLIHI